MKRLRTVRRIASESKAAPLVTSGPLALGSPSSCEPRRVGSLDRSREARQQERPDHHGAVAVMATNLRDRLIGL